MPKALPYAIAALVAVAIILQGASALYSYGSLNGGLAAKNEELDKLVTHVKKRNDDLDRVIQYVKEQQIKQQQIEDLINGDKDNSKVSNPVLIRTFDSVSECSGKPRC